MLPSIMRSLRDGERGSGERGAGALPLHPTRNPFEKGFRAFLKLHKKSLSHEKASRREAFSAVAAKARGIRLGQQESRRQTTRFPTEGRKVHTLNKKLPIFPSHTPPQQHPYYPQSRKPRNTHRKPAVLVSVPRSLPCYLRRVAAVHSFTPPPTVEHRQRLSPAGHPPQGAPMGHSVGHPDPCPRYGHPSLRIA